MNGDEVIGLITALYEAALEPERWHALVPALRALPHHPALERHLTLASGVRERLAALGSALDAHKALVERLPYALLWLDETARVLATNEAAERLLARRDGLVLRGGALRASVPEIQEQLERAIERAVAASRGGPKPGTQLLRIERAELEAVCTALVVPIPSSREAAAETHECAAVLVAVADPSAPALLAEEGLRQLFGLTPALARLAAAIANGRTLSEYAASAGVATGTARQQMKELLARTGARRQADLVRVILTSVAQLETS